MYKESLSKLRSDYRIQEISKKSLLKKRNQGKGSWKISTPGSNFSTNIFSNTKEKDYRSWEIKNPPRPPQKTLTYLKYFHPGKIIKYEKSIKTLSNIKNNILKVKKKKLSNTKNPRKNIIKYKNKSNIRNEGNDYQI